MGGSRRRRSELRALKSALAEGRKQDPSRVPPALRVWAILGITATGQVDHHCSERRFWRKPAITGHPLPHAWELLRSLR